MNFFKIAMNKIISAITSFLLPLTILSSTMVISVDSDKNQQTIDGWGTSACWWSQNVSDEKTRTELAKALYSKEGLGLNIYRYNVGAGVNPEHNRVNQPWRNTESFLYYNESSGKYEYDFNRDKNAQDFLFEALKYGCIDTVILFANSPHYSMTVSGEASGHFEKGVTNMAEDKYQDFVDYFLTVTEYFINKGVPVKYISPINEPQWDWSGDSVRQEGCHYEPEQVYQILRLFSSGIDERNLDVKLCVPESGDIDGAKDEYFKTIANDSEIAKNVGSYAYHSYWADTNVAKKTEMGKWLSGNEPFNHSKIEMSEWCELPCKHDVNDVEGAAIMARVIANDLNFSHATSWTSWVAVNRMWFNESGDNLSDGLFYATDDFSEYHIAKRYYALAHFSKFIPVGSVMVECKNNKNEKKNRTYNGNEWYYKHNTAAFKTPDGSIVLVIVNESGPAKVKLGYYGESMEIYTTDKNHTLEQTYSGDFKNKLKISENSITTVIVK